MFIAGKRFLQRGAVISLFGLLGLVFGSTVDVSAAEEKITPKGSAVVAFANLGALPIDPSYFIGSPEFPLVAALNSFLLYLNPKDARPEPSHADSWELAADQRTWTFHLTRDAKFHSGNPVTAHDYAYTYKKMAIEKRTTPAKLGALNAFYEKIWAEDDYTLKVRLKKPLATFLSEQGQSASSHLVPPVLDSKYMEKVGGDEFKKHPSLSGPYKVIKSVIGDYVEMEAFEDAYPRVPYTKKLKYIIVPEAMTRLAMVKTGQADVMTDVLGPVIPQAKATKGVRTVSAKEVDIIELIISDYWYQDEPSPLLDKRVRHALAYAINRQAIVDKLYYGEGSPQTILSATPSEFGADSTIKGYPYNPEKAKALLKEAGYKDGFSMKLTARPWHMDAATAISGFWADIGVKVDLREIEPGAYLRQATEKKLRGTWVTTVPTVPADLAIWYAIFYQETSTWSWNRDPFVNKKMAEMLSTMDPAEREKKMKFLSRYLTEELGSRIPVLVRNAVFAIGSNVENFEPGKGSYWYYPDLLKMKK